MLKYKELQFVLKNYCEIGMYDPKSGSSSEVTVMNLFYTEDEAGKDLKAFVEYTPVDIIDVTIQNSVDEDGNFKIFIELENNKDMFEKVCRILRDCSGIGGIEEWEIKIFKKDSYTISVEDIEKNLNIKTKFKEKENTDKEKDAKSSSSKRRK